LGGAPRARADSVTSPRGRTRRCVPRSGCDLPSSEPLRHDQPSRRATETMKVRVTDDATARAPRLRRARLHESSRDGREESRTGMSALGVFLRPSACHPEIRFSTRPSWRAYGGTRSMASSRHGCIHGPWLRTTASSKEARAQPPWSRPTNRRAC
jgi:hypothetical protein